MFKKDQRFAVDFFTSLQELLRFLLKY